MVNHEILSLESDGILERQGPRLPVRRVRVRIFGPLFLRESLQPFNINERIIAVCDTEDHRSRLSDRRSNILMGKRLETVDSSRNRPHSDWGS